MDSLKAELIAQDGLSVVNRLSEEAFLWEVSPGYEDVIAACLQSGEFVFLRDAFWVTDVLSPRLDAPAIARNAVELAGMHLHESSTFACQVWTAPNVARSTEDVFQAVRAAMASSGTEVVRSGADATVCVYLCSDCVVLGIRRGGRSC